MTEKPTKQNMKSTTTDPATPTDPATTTDPALEQDALDQEDYDILRDARGMSRIGAPLTDPANIKSAYLRLDSGGRFVAGWRQAINPADISMVQGHWALKHSAIPLGKTLAQAATVRAVTLIAEGEEGFVSMQCHLVSPLRIGGGNQAKLSENSLFFRDMA